jgi:cyclophilin family peptidyl-prolyl cis-trans isomerase/HEAT repeat protein
MHVKAIVCCLLLGGCVYNKNSFNNKRLQNLADFQDKRLTDSLYQFLLSHDKVERERAAIAFASLNDSTAANTLGNLLLEDPDEQARRNAAFALGQTKCIASVNSLIPAVNDKASSVVREVLEGLGKTIDKNDLHVLEEYHPKDTLAEEGLAWGFYRLGLRGITDSTIIIRQAAFLLPPHDEQTRLAAAHFFGRAPVNGKGFEDNLISTALHDPSADVRMAAASGLRQLKTDQALQTLLVISSNEPDYRVRINALRALRIFPWDKTKDSFMKGIDDPQEDVSIAAAELINSLLPVFDEKILSLARKVKSVRVQANLYAAILHTEKFPMEIVDEVERKYDIAVDAYQKADWIKALAGVTATYPFIFEKLQSREFVIKSTAATALTTINHHPDFKSREEFAVLYKEAMNGADPAVIGIVAEALADTALGYRNVIKDFSFLYEAKKKLHLPKDIESLQPLENAIAYFEGKPKPAPLKNKFNHPIDWESLKSAPAEIRCTITTSKGKIKMVLFPEESPGSVANFMNLANSGYFNGKYFHRMVPNFVIQTGCNRGDGFGSENYSIRSEIGLRRYKTGTVGMASAGPDTEGTQWFITHSPTPHLDGRYTIFGEVEQGMDVVDRIQVGDQILTVSRME